MARIWKSSKGFSSKKEMKLQGGVAGGGVQRDRSYIRRKLKWHHHGSHNTSPLGNPHKALQCKMYTSLHFPVNDTAEQMKENL